MIETANSIFALVALFFLALATSIFTNRVTTRQANRNRRFYESVSASNQAVITAENQQQLITNICKSIKEKTGFLRVSMIDRFGNVICDTDDRLSILDGSIGLNLLNVFDAARPHEPVLLKKSIVDIIFRPQSVSVGLYPVFLSQHAELMLCVIAQNNEYLDSDHIEVLKEMVGDLEFGIQHINKIHRNNPNETLVNAALKVDQLTGLPNKQDFMTSAAVLLKEHNNQTENVIVCYITANELNSASNNIWIHNSDEFIKAIAAKICNSRPPNVIAHRVGYSDFIVVNRVTKDTSIKDMAEKLLETITTTCLIDNVEVEITPSIGISIFPANGRTVSELAVAAQRAVFSASNKAKRIIFSETNSEGICQNAKNKLEAELKKSLAKGELELYYQPKVNLNSGEIISHEALIRWNHPVLGTILPQKFIELAEQNGFIIDMGRWVIREACSQIAKYKRDRSPYIKVAVNISPIQFYDEDLLECVREAMAENCIEPGELEFEITESVMIDNKNCAIKLMHEFKAMGICLSIDDFGTGHSSLAYIKDLPVDQVKIDRSFISGLPNDTNSAAIVKAIIDISNNLNIAVVAEGIETIEQASFMRQYGCLYGQGRLYGMPASIEKEQVQ